MRKFVLVIALAVLAWIFVVPSCSSEFGCAAGETVANADDGPCPSSIEEAASDAEWAAARLANIADGKVTTGLFYDDDGTENTFVSGDDDDAEHAAAALADAGAPASPIGTHPAATHVEVKAAVAMRDGDVNAAVMVINHAGGQCSERW